MLARRAFQNSRKDFGPEKQFRIRTKFITKDSISGSFESKNSLSFPRLRNTLS